MKNVRRSLKISPFVLSGANTKSLAFVATLWMCAACTDYSSNFNGSKPKSQGTQVLGQERGESSENREKNGNENGVGGIGGSSNGQAGGLSGGDSGGDAGTENDPCQDQSLIKQATTRTVIKRNDGASTRCPWNDRDNLGTQNSTMTARLEMSFPIQIPENHHICSMSADAGTQQIRYDDHLFLSINQYVIMGSIDYIKHLPIDVNGFPMYQWTALKGRESVSSKADRGYCANGVTCSLPQSEEVGSFSFSINPERSRALFSKLKSSDLQFRITLTGDDNPDSDCRLFNDLDLNIKYSYVQK